MEIRINNVVDDGKLLLKLNKHLKDVDFKDDNVLRYIDLNNIINKLEIDIKNLSFVVNIQDQYIATDNGFVGNIKYIVKRCIRKTIFWFVKPYVEQQNICNKYVLKCLENIKQVQTQLISFFLENNK